MVTSTRTKADAIAAYFAKPGPWHEAFARLRPLVLACGLTEELKWGHPCYTLEGTNVVLIHGFKSYCALLFFKGALLKDKAGLLTQQTEHTQSARQLRFASADDVTAMAKAIQTFVREAMAVEQSGQKVVLKPTAAFSLPEEFQTALDANAALKAAFERLTPGRQRAYLLHFAGAKQSATRAARVAKCTPRILDGKGLDD